MSIKTRNGVRTIECSFCDETEDAEAQEFRDCIDEWKDSGWRMFKKDGAHDWSHICPTCREANKKQYARDREDKGGEFD
jgi:hypothetical protein